MFKSFFIDVGGTFTDCIAVKTDGSFVADKVLSSAVVSSEVGEVISATSFRTTALSDYPDGFFVGFTAFFFHRGTLRTSAPISAFTSSSGEIELGSTVKTLQSGLTVRLHSPEPAPLLAIRKLLGLKLGDDIPELDVRLGTTAGTNALLERKGAHICFVTTKGFKDVPFIGTQARPNLFELNIKRQSPLFRHTVEIDERIDATGKILKPVDVSACRSQLELVYKKGLRSVAICFLNSVWNPVHEKQVYELATSIGFSHISLSHQLTPTIKFLDRADTTIADAYLSPVLTEYMNKIQEKLPESRVRVMTSAGGLVNPAKFHGKDCVLSGPAGGVVGSAGVSEGIGYQKSIGFDMGGTSTDVSRYDGQFHYRFNFEKAGVRLATPMHAIETVAAGGGSICTYDNQRLLVGPESAGADPGPCCYGRGGPLTITDMNLYMGRIDQSRFPFPLHLNHVQEKLAALSQEINKKEGRQLTPETIAQGFLDVANFKMATTIQEISSRQGYSPEDYLLVAFGGAAAQHACAIARILGMHKILVHPLAGVLSAYGIGIAKVQRFAETTVLQALATKYPQPLQQWIEGNQTRLTAELLQEGVSKSRLEPAELFLDLRYKGTDSTITIRHNSDVLDATNFEKRHQERFGYTKPGHEIEIVNVRLELSGSIEAPQTRKLFKSDNNSTSASSQNIWFSNGWVETPVKQINQIDPHDRVDGPLLIPEPLSTIVVEPGWQVEALEHGELLLTASEAGSTIQEFDSSRDPVRLELFNHQFTHIATQMGIILQRTAVSVNVKERLDFSCAVLDSQGRLVVNAPHVPVHLGAMSEAVKHLLSSNIELAPGDVYLSNDPASGGSHLPDLTTITPVFDHSGSELRFFVASRAHHAEIGGVRPGSGYPFAKNLAEEGVIFRNLKIVQGGRLQESLLEEALISAQYPSRMPTENIADIQAAIAANQAGVLELESLIDAHSWEVVSSYMQYIREAAASKTREILSGLGDYPYNFHDQMDDGSIISLQITPEQQSFKFDFSGSATENPTSMNANLSIVQSAILYCLRCLINADIPLNEGVLEPVEIILPYGMLNPEPKANPDMYPAVFAGNVEISQRLVDVILGAFGNVAASQGTMNNFIFGNSEFGYYETICGGSGAGEGFDGASAVHTHMTNTRLTDIEIIEHRYPVHVRRFALRTGSGGAGRWRGGDGVVREIEFLSDVELSLVTQRRTVPPYGVQGGKSGAAGENLLFRAGCNQAETLSSLSFNKIRVGDRLILKTPGGGGFGLSTEV